MTDLSENKIWQTLFYARLFGQNLTKEQLWQRLLRRKDGQILPKSAFEKEIKNFIDQGLLLEDEEKRLFWLPGNKQSSDGQKIYLKKWSLAKQSVELIKKVPFVKGIAVTGSIAGENCQDDDDLDFLIITEKNRVYWGRFFCYLLAMIKQKKRSRFHENNAWCFNLFLAEDKLKIPLSKRNLYGASQLKLLKPLWEKDGCLTRFKEENLWINDWFNEQVELNKLEKKTVLLDDKKKKDSVMKKIGDFGEEIMRKTQRFYMSFKITNELVSKNQIFFHPLKRSIVNQRELETLWKKELTSWRINLESKTVNVLEKKEKNFEEKESDLLTGSFDLLHQEHLFFIKEAIKKTKKLLIGIESDKRVRESKGKKRPIYNQDERRMRLQNLFPQATVFILPENFGDKQIREKLLKKLKIRKMFLASNDEKEELKRREVESLGIKGEIIKARKKLSMSKILQKEELVGKIIFKFDQEQVNIGKWKKI